jgi:uncharacterized membrane protein
MEAEKKPLEGAKLPENKEKELSKEQYFKVNYFLMWIFFAFFLIFLSLFIFLAASRMGEFTECSSRNDVPAVAESKSADRDIASNCHKHSTAT